MAETLKKNKLFSTTIEDDKVLYHIILNLQWRFIKELIKGNTLLRGRCKIYKPNLLKKEDEQDVRKKILDNFATDEQFKEALLATWFIQTKEDVKLVKVKLTANMIKESIDVKKPSLGIITALWQTGREDNRELADQLFATYLEGKEGEGKMKNMDNTSSNNTLSNNTLLNNTLLGKSLLEVLEEVAVTQERMSKLEKSLEEKDAQIAELKKEKECLSYTKGLKQTVGKMNENLEKLVVMVTKQQEEQEARFGKIEKQLEELEKNFVREARDNTKKQQENFKNAMDQMNNQVAKQVSKGISTELGKIFEEIKKIGEMKVSSSVGNVVVKEEKNMGDMLSMERVMEMERKRGGNDVDEMLLSELEGLIGE